MSRIAVLGAGSWGTALALSLARRHQQAGHDHDVTLWAHTPQHARQLEEDRENRRYLPGFAFPDALATTASLAEAVSRAEAVLLVVPSIGIRATVTEAATYFAPGALLVSAAKGIEDHSLLRMTEVVASALGDRAHQHPVGALSGPSFAQEVAAGAPTAATIAFADSDAAEQAQSLLSTETLRLYRNTDVIGVELGGALKNVLAIAAGAVSGLGLGHNSGAALITRGIAEITRLAVACGGRPETLAGLSGVGDILLTCTGALSRNRFVGHELGRGRTLDDIVAGLHGKVAEGVRATRAALALAARHEVSMPITEEVDRLLRGERSAGEAVRALMGRPSRDE